MTHFMCQFQRGKANVQNHEAFLFVIEHVIEMVTALRVRNVATSPAVVIEPVLVLVCIIILTNQMLKHIYSDICILIYSDAVKPVLSGH